MGSGVLAHQHVYMMNQVTTRSLSTTPQNAYMQYVRLRKSRKTREKLQSCVLPGSKLVEECFQRKSKPFIQQLFLDESQPEWTRKRWEKKAKQLNIHVTTIPSTSRDFDRDQNFPNMTGLSGGTEGVAAIIDLPHIYTDPKKAASLLRRPNARVLALDALQDPGNVGTLIRTAYLFEWDMVCLGVGTADTTNDKVTRASGGTTWDQPLFRGCISELVSEMVAQADDDRPVQYVVADHSADAECRGRGGVVVAQRDSEADNKNVQEDVQEDERGASSAAAAAAAVILVLGNEGNGTTLETPEAVLGSATKVKVQTREATMVGSLGVASAGAVLMHALSVQSKET